MVVVYTRSCLTSDGVSLTLCKCVESTFCSKEQFLENAVCFVFSCLDWFKEWTCFTQYVSDFWNVERMDLPEFDVDGEASDTRPLFFMILRSFGAFSVIIFSLLLFSRDVCLSPLHDARVSQLFMRMFTLCFTGLLRVPAANERWVSRLVPSYFSTTNMSYYSTLILAGTSFGNNLDLGMHSTASDLNRLAVYLTKLKHPLAYRASGVKWTIQFGQSSCILFMSFAPSSLA